MRDETKAVLGGSFLYSEGPLLLLSTHYFICISTTFVVYLSRIFDETCPISKFDKMNRAA
jgi:hypothetical protein